MKKIRVLIADDQNLICDGIRIILNSQPDIEVTAAAYDGITAVEYVAKFRPDVALLDIEMPGMTGLEALKKIKAEYPEVKVLMLTTFDPDDYILAAFRSGADGYLLKDLSGEKLSAAIRDAYAGNVTVPASIAARLIAQIPSDNQKNSLADFQLTYREIEIAQLLAQGYQNEKIVQTLGLTMGTAKNYISDIYSKLEVKNRKEAIMMIKGLSS